MKKSLTLYRRLLGYVAPYKMRFFLGLLMMGIAAGMEPAIPILLKPLLDGDFNSAGGGYPWLVGVSLVLLVFFRGVIGYGADYFMSWLANQVVLDLRQQMFQKILRFPAHTVDGKHSSHIISKVMNDVSNVMGACTTVLTSLVRDSISLIGLFVWLLWLNWQLTTILLIVVPMAGFVVKSFNHLMRRFSSHSQTLNAEILQVLQESIEGYRSVRIYGGSHYELTRFQKAALVWKKQQMRIAKAEGVVVPITQTIASVGLGIVIVVATYQASHGILTVGAMVSYLTASLMLMPNIRRISAVSATLQRGLAAAESVFSLLDDEVEQLEETPSNKAPPEVYDKPKRLTRLQRLKGDISFQDFSFAYPTAFYKTNETATINGAAYPVTDPPKRVLHHINLNIRAGESIALVGASGAGKTTIASILCGFYRHYDGHLKLDGVELSDFYLPHLRQQLAIVTQDVRLFDDTVRANIAYGELADKSDDDIRAAASAAYALDFIESLPDGFNTRVGERGIRLSGGQRQRLAIARALLKDAPILILDEATSALDASSEAQVQTAINNLMKNRTTIVIAHRLSTIRAVGRIIVLEGGTIVEEGSHEALLKQGGFYARYSALQREE